MLFRDQLFPACDVLDYGMGNLKSVTNALQYLGYDVRIIDQAQAIQAASDLLVPQASPDRPPHGYRIEGTPVEFGRTGGSFAPQRSNALD